MKLKFGAIAHLQRTRPVGAQNRAPSRTIPQRLGHGVPGNRLSLSWVSMTLMLLLAPKTLAFDTSHPASPTAASTVTVAQLSHSPRELVDEVWQLTNRNYIDPTFNGQDWNAVRREFLEQSYPSDEALYQGIQEMLARLEDPLTRFIPPDEFRAMQIDPNSNSVGIGLQITQNLETNELTVVDTIDDSPSRKAGIASGDILVSIDGDDASGMSTERAVALLRGEVGTPVTVRVQRNQQELEFSIVREPIQIRPIRYEKQDTPGGAIGYIRLTQFSADAPDEMRAAIDDLESQRVGGYILDLRGNSGGLLYAGTDIARMWMNEGTIFSTVDRQGMRDEQRANRTALTDNPLVILVDGGTSSASEILVGALQDNQRAILVGTQTLGHNSIQSIRGLANGSGLAVTVAKWYPPSGQDIQATGLTPDVQVELTEQQREELVRNRALIATPADPQYAAALSVLTAEMSRQVSMVFKRVVVSQ